MATYTITRLYADGQIAQTETRKRIDAARLMMERMVYDMHEANGTRDRPAAHIDMTMAKGVKRNTMRASCGTAIMGSVVFRNNDLEAYYRCA